MEFGAGSYALGYLAGLLSTLSPCVLPLVPILIGAAVVQHRLGPWALGAGLALSFTAVGLFLSTIGLALGLEAEMLRRAAAVLMLAFGLVLLVPALQSRLASATQGVAGAGQGMLDKVSGTGLKGQFAVGLLLGLVWTPCVGPTLGAATGLAAQGSQLPQVALLMVLFGLGAATPLVVLGSLSRGAMQRWRGAMLKAGQRGKWVLGAALMLLGVGILTGWDKQLEVWALAHSPAWLTALTTRY